MSVPPDPTDAIRRKAATFPGVAKGTSCNQSAFKAGKGTFLFIGPGPKGLGFKAMFKLEESMAQALRLAAKAPSRFEVGATGWVQVETGGMPLDEALAALRADPRVEAAEPNYLVRMAADPSDTMWRSGKQPYLKDIRLPKAWDRTKGMASAKIAIIDTGIEASHPAFQDPAQ